MAYGLCVENDNEDMHSKFMCKPCQGRIPSIRKQGLSEFIIKANKQMLLLSQKLWTPFNAGLTVSQCATCKHCSELSKGGRPKRLKRHTMASRKLECLATCVSGDTDVQSDEQEIENNFSTDAPKTTTSMMLPLQHPETPSISWTTGYRISTVQPNFQEDLNEDLNQGPAIQIDNHNTKCSQVFSRRGDNTAEPLLQTSLLKAATEEENDNMSFTQLLLGNNAAETTLEDPVSTALSDGLKIPLVLSGDKKDQTAGQPNLEAAPADHVWSVHITRMLGLCRVCGMRLQTDLEKSKKDPVQRCLNHSTAILSLFHIDVTKDTAIHSPYLCSLCYLKLFYYNRQEGRCISERWLQASLKQVKNNSHIWCDFDANISSLQCPLCSHHLSQCNGGKKYQRKKKRPHPFSNESESSTSVAIVEGSASSRQLQSKSSSYTLQMDSPDCSLLPVQPTKDPLLPTASGHMHTPCRPSLEEQPLPSREYSELPSSVENHQVSSTELPTPATSMQSDKYSPSFTPLLLAQLPEHPVLQSLVSTAHASPRDCYTCKPLVSTSNASSGDWLAPPPLTSKPQTPLSEQVLFQDREVLSMPPPLVSKPQTPQRGLIPPLSHGDKSPTQSTSPPHVNKPHSLSKNIALHQAPPPYIISPVATDSVNSALSPANSGPFIQSVCSLAPPSPSFPNIPQAISVSESVSLSNNCPGRHSLAQETVVEPFSNAPRRKCIVETHPGPLTLRLCDRATSPLWFFPRAVHKKDRALSPIKEVNKSQKIFILTEDMNTPPTIEEERIAGYLVKKILAYSENKNVLRIKTKGQPLYFQKLKKPRKGINIADFPSGRNKDETSSSEPGFTDCASSPTTQVFTEGHNSD